MPGGFVPDPLRSERPRKPTVPVIAVVVAIWPRSAPEFRGSRPPICKNGLLEKQSETESEIWVLPGGNEEDSGSLTD